MLPLGPAIVGEPSIDHCDIMGKVGRFDERTPAADPAVAAKGDGCLTVESEQRDMKCDDKGKIFGWLSESTAIAAEPEVRRSSYQYPDSSQVAPFGPSSASEAQGLQTKPERMEFKDGKRENDTGLRHSPMDDSIAGGVRLDQPTLAAMTAPQPIFGGESMESIKNSKTPNMATKRTMKVSSCLTVVRNSREMEKA